jgi:hypothetical protein
MKANRKQQSTFDFLRDIETMAVLLGAPAIERNGNDVSVLFRYRGSLQRGTIQFPDTKVADSFERQLRDLYPHE